VTDSPSPPEPWVGTNNGRGSFGQFAKGNKLATGNPLARLHYQCRKEFAEASSPEERATVRAKLLEMAIDTDHPGCLMAQKLYWEMQGGRQTLSVEFTGADGESIKVETASTIGVILAALSKHPEAKIAVAAALRGSQPIAALTEGGSNGPGV
jgi:hypothetical protein